MLDTNPETLRRALFLDRDGVINEEIGYLFRPEEVRFVPGIVSLCQTARRLGYRIIVVTIRLASRAATTRRMTFNG
jgi:histidinol phosphatase-like enzyme